jgi:hypothetical protein
MYIIGVTLALHWKSLSFTRVYCPARWCSRSWSTLSFGKPTVLKYMMNGVRQSKWISMTLGDSVILSLGGGVSSDDSAALGSFAKAFFLARYACTQDHQNCFLTSRAPGNIAAFYRPNMTTFCGPNWQRAVSPREPWVSGCWVPWRSLDHEAMLHTWLHC